MNILPILTTKTIKPIINRPFIQSFRGAQKPAAEDSFAKSEISKFSQKYYEAKEFVDEISKYDWLPEFEISELEGIQEGIKVFEGLTFTQIAFMLNRLHSILVFRGCYNKCVHCYAKAEPPVPIVEEAKTDKLRTMGWEDFCDLTEGIQEINKRLKGVSANLIDNSFISPFHDSDCMDIVLKDKDGKEHDFIDIAEKIYATTKLPVLFDTCGWTQKNKKAQERAEKFVKYFSDPQNSEKIYGVNISLNPFHKLNSKYVEYLNSDPIRAKKFRDLYTDRMANVLYTFSPVVERDELIILSRAILDKENVTGYCEKDLEELGSEIYSKLKQKYIENKVLNSRRFLDEYEYHIYNIHSIKIAQGRMKDLVPKSSSLSLMRNKYMDENTIERHVIQPNGQYEGLIDADGKYYLTNNLMTYETDIQLNFKNKNKKTPPVEPERQDKIFDKSYIDKYITASYIFNN